MGCSAPGWSCRGLGAAGAVTRAGVDMFDALPSEFTAAALSQQSKILDAKGNVIATPRDENRVIIPLDQVAPVMQKAQIAIEDSRFFEHGGVDVRAMVGPWCRTPPAPSTPPARSATRQYVGRRCSTPRSRPVTPRPRRPRSPEGLAGVTRKLQELKYSIQLEKEQTKDQILQGYLNIVYYGDQAYGVQAASKHYFNKDAKDLGLPSGPARRAGPEPGDDDPVHNPDKACPAQRRARPDARARPHHRQGADRRQGGHPRPDAQGDVGADRAQSLGDVYAYFCDYVIKWLEVDPWRSGARQDGRRAQGKIFGGGLTIQTTSTRISRTGPGTRCSNECPKGNS